MKANVVNLKAVKELTPFEARSEYRRLHYLLRGRSPEETDARLRVLGRRLAEMDRLGLLGEVIDGGDIDVESVLFAQANLLGLIDHYGIAHVGETIGDALKAGEAVEIDPGIEDVAHWVEFGEEDPDPLVADIESGAIIGRAEAGFIFGPTGTGKTAVANAINLAIASGSGLGKAHLTGQPHYACKAGRVLVAVYEAQADFRRRIRGIAKESGIELSHLDWGIIKADLDITLERDRKLFVERVRKDTTRNDGKPPLLITIDTLPAAVGGKSLNDDDVAGHCFALARALIDEFGCSVIFIAHPGKDETKGIAGSYRLRGNSDFVLKTVKTKSGYRLIKDKDRGGACDRAIFDYTLNFVEVDRTSSGKPITGAVVGSITPCASHDEQREAMARPTDGWAKSLRPFKAALTTVLLDSGKALKPYGDEGPTVTASALETLRAEFTAACPAETADGKRMRFNRALQRAAEDGLICSREISGVDHVWITEPNTSPNKQNTL
ncbi:AAA family ATPase [Bradyrhizobium genomosp. III]|uniref:AAA family ATPase n=1 Tax=Bradyrhizobium genomosp. III TaxID=2683271 RepID=UPI000576361F|nr:AAA family ATPase [Bradyrhizobium sp. CCBAU 15544]